MIRTLQTQKSWNLYVYVRNNPLRFIDPTGNIIEEKDGKVRTEKREHNPSDEDHNVDTFKDGTHVLKYGRITIDKKVYVIVWTVEKVWVFADDKTPIKALKATSGIMLFDKDSGKIIDEKKSMEMLQKETNRNEVFNNETNCYGFALAKGQVWLQDTKEIKKLMKGDNYDLDNAKTTANVGDIGIFSDQGKNVDGMQHMVRVTASTNGQPTQVESKNGITNTVRTAPQLSWSNKTDQLFYFSKKVKE
mgnify:CR=1 FL=1|jgi:hypothetical protein